MIPYAEDIFEIFTLVLNFIAKKHLEVVSEFRGTSEMHTIESLKKFKSEEMNTTDTPEDKKDEDDDDDDYEWI